ncbi:MAG: hypothetical protein O3A39_00665 [Proteobacteria bacterium]|nr:hypothetical protein [Pseudomonadota bacterium]MDA1135114.1 hypothetical protein [Pseudomonadota bacterium]
MKSLNIDIIFPWEFGIIFLVLGLLLIVIGSKQSKKEFDIDKMPITKPTTKILFGSFLCIFGLIQLMPLLK